MLGPGLFGRVGQGVPTSRICQGAVSTRGRRVRVRGSSHTDAVAFPDPRDYGKGRRISTSIPLSLCLTHCMRSEHGDAAVHPWAARRCMDWLPGGVLRLLDPGRDARETCREPQRLLSYALERTDTGSLSFCRAGHRLKRQDLICALLRWLSGTTLRRNHHDPCDPSSSGSLGVWSMGSSSGSSFSDEDISRSRRVAGSSRPSSEATALL
jgi:hypothetical protein